LDGLCGLNEVGITDEDIIDEFITEFATSIGLTLIENGLTTEEIAIVNSIEKKV
jgi:hypothetical protein